MVLIPFVENNLFVFLAIVLIFLYVSATIHIFLFHQGIIAISIIYFYLLTYQ